MVPPIHLGAWSMALMLWLPFELLLLYSAIREDDTWERHARTRNFSKSDPFLRSTLQQPQVEIYMNSTFGLDANTEVWELK